jgi:hypothetical protein
MHQIIQALNDWYLHALQSGGCPLVALLMAVKGPTGSRNRQGQASRTATCAAGATAF